MTTQVTRYDAPIPFGVHGFGSRQDSGSIMVRRTDGKEVSVDTLLQTCEATEAALVNAIKEANELGEQVKAMQAAKETAKTLEAAKTLNEPDVSDSSYALRDPDPQRRMMQRAVDRWKPPLTHTAARTR